MSTAGSRESLGTLPTSTARPLASAAGTAPSSLAPINLPPQPPLSHATAPVDSPSPNVLHLPRSSVSDSNSDARSRSSLPHFRIHIDQAQLDSSPEISRSQRNDESTSFLANDQAPMGLMDPTLSNPRSQLLPIEMASLNPMRETNPSNKAITHTPTPHGTHAIVPSTPNHATPEVMKRNISANSERGDDGRISPEQDFYAASDGDKGMDSPHPRKSKKDKRSCRDWCACPASCGGYNFVKVFVILTALQVVVTGLLVWAIGYSALVSATGTLSGQVREAIMTGVLSEINHQLSLPLQAADSIHYLTQARFPNIEFQGDIRGEPGYLADLYNLGLKYPTMARIGFFTNNGIYTVIQRATNTATFSSVDGMYVTLGNSSGIIRGYQPKPIPSRNLVPNVYPLRLNAEIRDSDSADFINAYLGDPVYDSTFKVSNIRFFPAVLAAVNSSVTRQLDPTATELELGWSPPFTQLDLVGAGNAGGTFLALVAFKPTVNALNGNFSFAGFAHFKLTQLEASLVKMPFGDHGAIHLVRAAGDILASSDEEVSSTILNSQAAYLMKNSPNPVITRSRDILIEWGLVVPTGQASNATLVTVPYTGLLYSRTFSASGHSWRLEAKQLDNDISALPYTVCLLTRDDDWNGGITTAIRNTAIAASIICLVAMLLSLAITRCLTRPLLHVVDHMYRAVEVISMDRGQSQRSALSELCESWASESGMVLPPLLSTKPPAELTKPINPFTDTPVYASFCWLCNDTGDTCCCYRVGRSLREVQMMHAAFGSMLYTLASYDELEAINQAKRQFIRYIFHEVRVPFNAIVLGIEQMQMELAPHQLMLSGSFETLDILREQSAVVSRILNDVLSMQKIEDGALVLEQDNFSLEKMIRGALYAFRTPCMEKRLKVHVSLMNLDDLVNEALPGLRLGRAKKIKSKTRDGAAGNGQAKRFGENTTPERMPLTAPSCSPPGVDTDSNIPAPKPEVCHAYVRGDPYRLRQCLANFISNSIKFTPIGGLIRVSLEVSHFECNPLASIASDQLLISMGMEPKQKSRSRGSKHTYNTSVSNVAKSLPQVLSEADINLPEILGTATIKVSVKDSGSGIPLDYQPHIFQAYMQVQPGKLQQGNGCGLGLSICKSIVELHGGTIGFSSTPGEGTEFHFSLPLDVMLVKSSGRDSSSYAPISSTAGTRVRIGGIDSLNERKLETVPASPDKVLRDIHESPLLPSSESTSFQPSGCTTVTDTPLSVALQPLLRLPSVDSSVVNTVPEEVQAVGEDTGDTNPVTFHDEGGDANALLAVPEKAPGSASASAGSTESPEESAPPASSAHYAISSNNNANSSMPPTAPPNPSSAFYSTGSLRKKGRGLRGSQLGVNIPSGSTSTSHAPAQNLTESIKPAVGTSAGSGSATSANSASSAPSPAPSITATPGAAATNAANSSSSLKTKSNRLPNIPLAPTQGQQATDGVGGTGPAKLRVLVVEDSLPNRRLMMQLLTRIGCVATGVENGLECVNLFKDCMNDSPTSSSNVSAVKPVGSLGVRSASVNSDESDPRCVVPASSINSSDDKRCPSPAHNYPVDVILMDGSMPVMNGVEATQILRQRGVQIPIIAITGNALAEDVNAFVTAGCNCVLTKPCTRVQLQKTLTQFTGINFPSFNP